MSAPSSQSEYLERFFANTEVTGYGLDTAQHIPCPWCAAPDFMVLYPFRGVVPGDQRPGIDVQMGTVHKCGECKRSGRNVVHRTEDGVSAEFVQTGGDDAPEWLSPAPAREVKVTPQEPRG